MEIKKLIFNPLQENTYIIFDETKECVIVDPGCYTQAEKDLLKKTIAELGVTPKAIINTHCHFDHVFGRNFVADEYNVELWAHEAEFKNIARFASGASLFGIRDEEPRQPEHYFKDGDIFKFGNSELKVIHTPGHAPGSVCFYSDKDNFLISGDTLFAGTIGRTDLPGGDLGEMKDSLKKLMELPGETKVYCGHGPDTTIGKETLYNDFINDMFY